MRNAQIDQSASGDKPRLGLLLAVIQIVAYFAFVTMCSYHPTALKSAFLTTGVPLSFVSGIAVILLGVVLTAIYVVACRRSSER
ncbi:DUF485 domain-containing protein [Robbsia sp. KACC 23696]|uniref:DUF485 domain-containing protein n=1 Tax=Robbsia sp. KACC 23696 TaxID=3149231 RepID=UPI00325A483D